MSLEARSNIRLSDFLHFSFWRYLTKAIWLFFPAIIFLVAVYACFWSLTQGKDLMVITLENRDVFVYFILAQLFWSYVTWYSSRLVAKAKEFEQPCEDPVWTVLRVQGPRLLAFTCYTLVLLAFFQLEAIRGLPHLPSWICLLLLLLSLPLYFFVYARWDRFTNQKTGQPKSQAFLKLVQKVTWWAWLVALILVIILKSFAALVVLLLVMQQALVLLLITRRKILDNKKASYYQQPEERRGFNPQSSLRSKSFGLLFDKEDKGYFRFFIYTGLFVLVIYALTVFSVRFSVMIGAFPFVFMAFGVLLILGNTVAFFSVLKHFNFHIVLIGLAFLIGKLFEPHYVQLVEKQEKAVYFHKRQDLKTYFTNWINNPVRKKQLDDTSVRSYPVFLALADGGASRSGYWVASVLSKLEDTTQGVFSQHLLCLSGASGGSVGNAAFFILLRSKDRLLKEPGTTPYYSAAIRYLGSDFLTFTLARMLGPDVFRHILPLRQVDDRAAALAHALETACGGDAFLYDSLAVPLSRLVTQKNNPDYALPILCINTTRMQDGSPAVISNIDLRDSAFNKRIDVLNLLDEAKDMKLSSAVVLGASFPYVSPAGRIDSRVMLQDSAGHQRRTKEPVYFVDGGYFDNSGAGVVNEMLIALRNLLENDSAFQRYAAKLQFFVLHISNNPVGDHLLQKINPFTNDLAAPIKTLLGAYGSQTAVNDRRLENYMKGWYKGNDGHYITINLYRLHETNDYSMNWVISGYLLAAMQERLRTHENLQAVLKLIQ